MALSEAAMVLPLVILSILCGLFSALGVVLAGGGFWLACLAYAGAGALVLTLALAWVALCMPPEGWAPGGRAAGGRLAAGRQTASEAN